jgi:poly(A) polymerase
MAPAIHQVSSERIREELVRILTDGQAAAGVRMLEESGLRREILPEVQWAGHLERSLEMLPGSAEPDFAMAVLLHETPLAQAQAIVERLKFSRAEIHHVLALVENLPKLYRVRSMSVSDTKRFFRIARFEDYLELARIHGTAADEDLEPYHHAVRVYRGWTREDMAPPPVISGDDLIRLGFSPGPAFKEILGRIEDEQLEGRVTDYEQAVQFVLKHYGKQSE